MTRYTNNFLCNGTMKKNIWFLVNLKLFVPEMNCRKVNSILVKLAVEASFCITSSARNLNDGNVNVDYIFIHFHKPFITKLKALTFE